MQENSQREKPRISVVIPTYNYAHFLPRAIESVLAQTAPIHEILVADDGSTDETGEVVKRYPVVKYHWFPHAGVYALRAAILPMIAGEWYFNLDADNWLAPDFMEQMKTAFEDHEQHQPKVAFFYPDMVMHGDASGLNARPDFDVQRLKQGNYLDMNSLIRTDVARQYGFDPAFNSGQGDYDFFLTLVKNGYQGIRVPGARLHYHAHGDSLSRTASRRRQQRRIMKRIVRKHRDFFSPEERKVALACAANRVLVSLINGRSPYAGPWRRMRDLGAFLRVGARHAELRNQWAYTIRPRPFHAAQTPPGDIFFLFRDTPQRRSLLRQAPPPQAPAGGREQLFGYDVLAERGFTLHHNLEMERVASMMDLVQAWRERRDMAQTGVGLGDERSVAVHLPLMNRSCCVLATTDTVGLPALRARRAGRLRIPLVYVSIGMPERIQRLRCKAPHLERQYKQWFWQAEHLVAYGYAEAQWMQEWLGDRVPVTFVPFGVDASFWSRDANETDGPGFEYDVLSIGSDPMRDFGAFVAYARAHPGVRCALIAGRTHAAALAGSCPQNVSLQVEMPVERVRQFMRRSRVVLLPLKENTYSGATTTLLQAMAMQCAVAVSRVGAIRDGYGFEGGRHLCWIEPENRDSLFDLVNQLLGDETRCRTLGAQGRDYVLQNLTWEHYVNRLLAVLPVNKKGADG